MLLLFLCIVVYVVVCFYVYLYNYMMLLLLIYLFLFLVRAYVCPTDNDLANEIQKATKDFPAGLHSLFSRNKMFRRKIKRKKNKFDRSITQ